MLVDTVQTLRFQFAALTECTFTLSFQRTYHGRITGTICTTTRPFAEVRHRSVGTVSALRDGRSGDRIPVGGEIFRTRPDRSRCLPNLLHNGCRVVHFREQSDLITCPNLAPRLKKEFRYTSTPPQCLYGKLQVNLPFIQAHTHTYVYGVSRLKQLDLWGKINVSCTLFFCSNAVDHFRVTLLSPNIIIGIGRMTVRWVGYVARTDYVRCVIF